MIARLWCYRRRLCPSTDPETFTVQTVASGDIAVFKVRSAKVGQMLQQQ